MNSPTTATVSSSLKLLDQLAAKTRLLHYSERTEEAYVDWAKRFILFHQKRHPREMGAAEIETYLTHLAVEKHVSASTQNQAFSAILFLYQKVLEIELPKLNALRARRPERLPVVLSVEEVRGNEKGTRTVLAIRGLARTPRTRHLLEQSQPSHNLIEGVVNISSRSNPCYSRHLEMLPKGSKDVRKRSASSFLLADDALRGGVSKAK